MHIYSLSCRDLIEHDIFLRLLNLVDNEKKNKILRYRREEDAQHSLFAYLIPKYFIAKLYNKQFNKIKYKYNDYGKPLLDSDDSIYFNVSHAGDYVVCAIDNSSIGIDIELIKDIEIKIANRFFCKEEASYVYENSDRVLERFYEVWTKKESYIKAIGTGLSTKLDSFNVINGDGFIDYDNCKYYFKSYFIDDNYKLSVCSMKKDADCNIIDIDINLFVDKILCNKLV